MWYLLIGFAAAAVCAQLYRVLGSYDPTGTGAAGTADRSLDRGAESEPQRRTQFMRGAAEAYRLITEALFAGDLNPCSAFLEPQVRAGFEAQIAGHRAAGRTLRLSENLLESYDLLSMNENEAVMRFDVSLRYTSVENGRENQVSTRLQYVWTFRKTPAAADNAWKLSAVDMLPTPAPDA